MFGLDEWLAEIGAHGGISLAMVAALLLGLRHATDPDHLTAVSTLVLSDASDVARRAGVLGLFWGFGHAVTLFAFGLPIILFRSYLPEAVTRAAEVAIGLLIFGLALRLLVRWHRGYYHAHTHSHNGVRHAHPHVHEGGKGADHAEAHEHSHAESLGRSPVGSFGIGLVHGVGGSAGAGVLLVAAVPGRAAGVVALLLYAAGTAGSMGGVSWLFGRAITRPSLTGRFSALVPAFGVASLLFGVWYGLGAIGTVPYVF